MRFQNIQVLRLVAAVGVIVIHLPVYASRGFDVADFLQVALAWIGNRIAYPVPLFFAISGFVLTHALHSTPISRFLLARFLRLYPGFWLAVAVAIVAAWFTYCPAEYSWPDRLVLLRYVGFSLAPRGPGSLYPLGVEWSLIYEVALSVGLAGMGLFGVRRGVPLLAGAWLATLLVKNCLWPGYATDSIPTWGTVLLSGYNVPFLCGVLAYYLKDRGHAWRWPLLAVTLSGFMVLPPLASSMEWLWAILGFLSGMVVWLAVHVPQVSEDNAACRLGDYTYGLYLLHVPVMVTGFYVLTSQGWLVGRWSGVWLVGAAALVLGLLFGRLEYAVHRHVRHLARTRYSVPWTLRTFRPKSKSWTG